MMRTIDLVRDAILSQPRSFTTLDIYAALPHVPLNRVSAVMPVLVERNVIEAAGMVKVSMAINGQRSCGTRREVEVRAWVRLGAPAVTASAAADTSLYTRAGRETVSWLEGARRVDDVLREAWPASAAVNQYADERSFG